MLIEAVIPAYKPNYKLYKLINRLEKQTVVPERISIMLTIDKDEDFEAFCEGFGGEMPDNVVVVPIMKSDFSHGGTRDEGIRSSQSDYILMMTQDAVPADSNLVVNLLKALKKENAACAYARQIPLKKADAVERFSRLYNYPARSRSKSKEDYETLGIKTIFFSDTCSIYKRDVYQKLGGFDRETDFNEDMIFAYKAVEAGYTVEYAADAVVFHSHSLDLADQYLRSRDNAVSQKAHPEIFNKLKSESEGIKYFITGMKYFVKRHEYFAVVQLFASCVARYLGFFIGKHFE